MRVYVLEDIRDTRKLIINTLKTKCKGVEVCGSSDNIAEAEKQIIELDPDLLILDIRLGNHTVFELLKRFREVHQTHFLSIILSAYGDFAYAKEAIHYGVIEFLSKPLDEAEFVQAVAKAEAMINATLPEGLPSEDQLIQQRKLAIRQVKSKFLFYSIDDIVYLKAEGSTTRLFMNNGVPHLQSVCSLREFSSAKLVQQYFITISRSCIINPRYLKSYDHRTGELELDPSKTRLKASRKYAKKLFDSLP